MIKADYHMHTYFSSDSDTPPEAMALGAIKKGLRWICITDHHDWDYPEDNRFGHPAIQAFHGIFRQSEN